MDNEFFEPSGGGDASIQHISWFLGHPSVWLTIFLWVLILIAAFKISKRLLRANKTLWLILFIATVGAALTCYAGLMIGAFHSYKEGLLNELRGVRYANFAVILLSIMSGFWIIAGWIKPRQ